MANSLLFLALITLLLLAESFHRTYGLVTKGFRSRFDLIRKTTNVKFSKPIAHAVLLKHQLITSSTILPLSTNSNGSSGQTTATSTIDHETPDSPIAVIRPSIADKARTITHVCNSGTLCTTSVIEEVLSSPFGSYADYILDSNGWPVMLLSDQSLHTSNIKQNPNVSLFCQLPRSQISQAAASLSRVSLIGKVEPMTPSDPDMAAIKLAFTLVHQYAEQIIDSPKFSFYRMKPQKIYFSGGFGVMATWVDVAEYEQARPDVLAQEVAGLLAKLNSDKQGELNLLCKFFLNLQHVDEVRIQATDRLGIDLRVKTGDFTDEYRIGFRNSVNSAEDAKSEIMKLFQEVWERSTGYYYTSSSPPVMKYAEDILRKKA